MVTIHTKKVPHKDGVSGATRRYDNTIVHTFESSTLEIYIVVYFMTRTA